MDVEVRGDDDGVLIETVTNLESVKGVDERGVEGMRVDEDVVVVQEMQPVEQLLVNDQDASSRKTKTWARGRGS